MEEVENVPKYALILDSLLSECTLRGYSETPHKAFQEKKRDLVYQAKKVDSAREHLDYSLRDMHACTSRMEKDVKKHEFLNRGKLVEAALHVSMRESFLREEIAKFMGILNTEPGLVSAFHKGF